MKKFVAMILVLCMALCFAVPVMAASQEKELGTRASLVLDGGMVYDTNSGKFIIYGEAFGAEEQKTVTVTLYRKSGNTWLFVDSVSNSGTTATVQARKFVTLQYSGEYRVWVSGMTSDSSGTTPYYYNVTV